MYKYMLALLCLGLQAMGPSSIDVREETFGDNGYFVVYGAIPEIAVLALCYNNGGRPHIKIIKRCASTDSSVRFYKHTQSDERCLVDGNSICLEDHWQDHWTEEGFNSPVAQELGDKIEELDVLLRNQDQKYYPEKYGCESPGYFYIIKHSISRNTIEAVHTKDWINTVVTKNCLTGEISSKVYFDSPVFDYTTRPHPDVDPEEPNPILVEILKDQIEKYKTLGLTR